MTKDDYDTCCRSALFLGFDLEVQADYLERPWEDAEANYTMTSIDDDVRNVKTYRIAGERSLLSFLSGARAMLLCFASPTSEICKMIHEAQNV